MGKPTTSPSYRDEPNDEDALSMHTTRGDYGYQDAPDLPTYADSEATAVPLPHGPPPADEYAIIREPQTAAHFSRHGKPVNVSSTSMRMDVALNDPDALHDYITNYLRVVPPKPTVRIYGFHHATTHRNNKKETERVVDFDLAFSLEHLLREPRDPESGWWTPRVVTNGDKAHRGTFRRVRAEGSTQDIEVGSTPARDLRDWCADFCSSKASLRIFRVSRTVTGLDTTLLQQHLDRLVRATHYRGNLAISFPISDHNVDIYSPHVVNQWRLSWIRWLFYLSFLWLLTWPILFFTTKKWSVYTIDWAFSLPASVGGDGGPRRYASLSEMQWIERYANLINNLVMEKYQGDATDMPFAVDAVDSRRARGTTGNADVDSAIGFVHGGLSVWNSLSSGRAPSRAVTEGWGGDER